MKTDQFVAQVRQLGEYPDNGQAEQVTRTVLSELGTRLAEGERDDLAAQLPPEIGSAVTESRQPAQRYGVEEFVRRIAQKLGTGEETARWDASAVLSTVSQAVSGGELNNVLSQLPAGFAELFGKPDLT